MPSILDDLVEAAAKHDDATTEEMGHAIASLVAVFVATEDLPAELMLAAVAERIHAYRAAGLLVGPEGLA